MVDIEIEEARLDESSIVVIVPAARRLVFFLVTRP